MDKPYTEKNYKNKILVAEKKSLIRVLKKTKGNRDKAWKILCPANPVPFYSFDCFNRRIRQHQINTQEFKKQPTK